MDIASVGCIQDVDTCWNSGHDMMFRSLKLKEAITLELLMSDVGGKNLISSELEAAPGMITAVQPIAEATRELSGGKYSILSSVIPFLYGCEAILKQ